ncbi:Zn-dependent hydrolase [Actinocrispum wychmicini]|uniref:N-carbamoyl-L-amino-acid hydrolase n=1 Tax=Actinocrispum wychmicini TaxID=1213861 RepID=A0A4R2JDJ4_9PSEU|nr:Zn-dependent hydrolase [Actinocrispum wychmicini]TCO54858.1 N-carbamoyl-L-amino-acid hydrolase [Actinocrispum wychmicini]
MSTNVDPTTSIDAGRLLRRIAELAAIGADRLGGVTRPGFGAADRAAIQYLRDTVRADRLHSTVDPAGNLIIRGGARSGDRPVLLMGSHIDTVVNGGRLDGSYGVLAAIEVLTTITTSGPPTRCEPVVVAFANEEGALFQQPFWGSLAIAGGLADTTVPAVGVEDHSLSDALRLAGGDPADIQGAAWPPGTIESYLELHIEQGPVLERTGARIGIVDRIVGRTVFDVEIHGTAGHAGTTPMSMRRDGLATAAHVILAVQRIAAERCLCRVATVGHISVAPNNTNVVPGRVRLTVEIRDTTTESLLVAEAEVRREIKEISERTTVPISVTVTTRVDPRSTDDRLRALIGDAADALDLPSVVLPSGAGHDAQIIAAVAPIAMIFVPSVGGVSHVPEEHTADEDLVAGAQVLLHTVLRH